MNIPETVDIQISFVLKEKEELDNSIRLRYEAKHPEFPDKSINFDLGVSNEVAEEDELLSHLLVKTVTRELMGAALETFYRNEETDDISIGSSSDVPKIMN